MFRGVAFDMLDTMFSRLIATWLGACSLLIAQDGGVDHFEQKIRPVLAARCYACHSAAASPVQGGLRLDSAAGIRQGGNSGPLIQAGNPEQSLLLRALRHTDKTLKMPPGKPLPAETLAEFETWIRAGAPLPMDRGTVAAKQQKLWSLEPPVVRVPDGTAPNPIDRFIVSKLAEKQLTPSAEADKRTLVRRATYDLTGLPASLEEVGRFVQDRSQNAYESLIDRLLASPQYGERWGRHWLDVARYADSVNDSVNTGNRYAWSYTYRDWVIKALNDDLPYDRFLLYQLAADRVKGAEPRHLAALGYLSLGREFPNSFHETVDDRIDAVTRGMMGFTVACARCHDHKYDPIPTKDYYSLYSIFSNIRMPEDLPLLGKANGAGMPGQYSARLQKIRQAQEEYRVRRHAEMVTFFKTQTAEYIRGARDAEGMSNTDVEELVRDRQLNSHVLARWRKFLREANLLKGSEPAVLAAELTKQGKLQPAEVPLEEFELIYTEGDSNNTRAIRVRYNTLLAHAAYDGSAPRAMAVEDVPNPTPGHVFVRGNPANPGALTPPHFLSCLGGSDERAFKDGSGRLELAQSIIDPKNPLTARVIVNRVWMHHFGAGIVRTPSDFGFRGDAPTHPELLDYLAVKFVQQGWSLKKLHRMIMTSAAYRQSSDATNEAAKKVDPENLLLWRMNRRRLEIEAVRDSMLVAAGRLDAKAGGTPFDLMSQPSIARRSVYGFIERGKVPAMLSAFDFSSPDQHAPMRFVTTVPQQALFFLNSPFVAEQAEYVGARVDRADAAKGVRQMYRILFAREPDPAEIEAGVQFLSQTKDDTAKPAEAENAWRYGTGSAEGFQAFPVFLVDRWQGGGALPDPKTGKAVIRAGGGEPGEHPQQAVTRRWVSPVAAKISIEGTLKHNQPLMAHGDGVRGRIVSSRLGELASFVVNGSATEAKLTGVAVENGDTIDFVVDSRQDPENDAFTWAPVIKTAKQTWTAAAEFVGPAPKKPGVWTRYAHVLLETNEFAFVD